VTDLAERANPRIVRSLAQHAYDRLLEQILSGTLRGGEVINERRLADQLDVSRTPLRDALKRLEGEGLLCRSADRVLTIRLVTVGDYMDNLQVRRLLEPEAARFAAGRIPAERIALLRERLLECLASEDSSDADWKLGSQLHEMILDCAGNPVLGAIVRTLRRQGPPYDGRKVTRHIHADCREHLAILEAIASGEGEAARQAMIDHLDRLKSHILAALAGA